MSGSEPRTRTAACLLLTLLLPAGVLGTRSYYTGARPGTLDVTVGRATDEAAESSSSFATRLMCAAGRALLPKRRPSDVGRRPRAGSDALMLVMLITQRGQPTIALSR